MCKAPVVREIKLLCYVCYYSRPGLNFTPAQLEIPTSLCFFPVYSTNISTYQSTAMVLHHSKKSMGLDLLTFLCCVYSLAILMYFSLLLDAQILGVI